MSLTNFAALTAEEKTIWAMDMWRNARNHSFVNKFVGKGPNSMIQHITELKKDQKGARAVITLLADLEGDGVAGDRTLEGNEEPGKSYEQVIRVDMLRHAQRHEGRMADQKSIVEFRENSRDALSYWLGDRIDQMAFLTLAGIAYTKKPDGSTRVGSDLPNLEFAADVTTPTAARRLRWDATAGTLSANAAITSVDSDDFPSYKMLVNLKAYLKSRYVRGIKGDGNSETYHVFMTPEGVARLKMDADIIANLRNGMSRGKDNPLFTGAVLDVDGIVVHEFRHVPNTKGTGATKFGQNADINGQYMIVCGAQALAMADIGQPLWEEKEFDYGNQPGISTGKIVGFKKPQFHSIYEGSVEDFGAAVVYTAV
jgi:N4-gp56 family major capsid protein